jgi:hypothetical protein
MRKSLMLGLLALAGTAFIAKGSIGLEEPSITGSNGSFTWNYAGTIFQGETITPGSFFTIFDFGSILPASNSEPTGWSFSTNLSGNTPIGTPTIKDDPNVLNLTWMYTGNTPIVGNNTIGNLGTFSVITNTNQLRDGEWAGQATSTVQGSIDFTQRNVGVPVPEASTFLPVLSVCGAAIAAGIPSLIRRRKNL